MANFAVESALSGRPCPCKEDGREGDEPEGEGEGETVAPVLKSENEEPAARGE